jgi:hypothetical protein
LIAAALRKIRRNPLLRHACRAELTSCEALLEGVNPCPVKLADPSELPRTAQPFVPVCALARILLGNGGLAEGHQGVGLSFLINLEQLFERTVVKAFQDAGVVCHAKHPLPYRSNSGSASFQMDLFCPDFDGAPLVVDAKFKTKVSPSNLQQVVTYCVMTGASKAVLVLPSGDGAEQSYTVPTAHGPITIKAVHLDVANRTVEEWRQSAARLVRALAAQASRTAIPGSLVLQTRKMR